MIESAIKVQEILDEGLNKEVSIGTIPDSMGIIEESEAPNLIDLLTGLSQLTITGVIETTSIVEAIHQEIALRPFGLFNDKYTRIWGKGISARVYSLVRSITSLVGKSLAMGINQYSQMMFSKQSPPIPNSLKMLISAINGVMGDHLVTNGNPLALPMMFYTIESVPYRNVSPKQSGESESKTIAQAITETETETETETKSQNNIQTKTKPQTERLTTLADTLNKSVSEPNIDLESASTLEDSAPEVSAPILNNQIKAQTPLSGRVVIIAHGLCMSHLNWLPDDEEGLGQTILKQYPLSTVLYLDYNSGQRISINGSEFADLMQRLIDQNPSISEIDLVGHSMGGLVYRSALYYGTLRQYDWVTKVQKLITIGTPHHGAVLERIGDVVQQSISKVPFAGSLSKLGDIRSTGIIDLRHGSIRDEDWKSLTTRSVLPDEYRQLTPLPEHIDTYFLAGTLSESDSESVASLLLGDGLVTIKSALGEHTEEHTLRIPEENKAVFYGISHLGLLTDPKIKEQVLKWLNKDEDNKTNRAVKSEQ